VLAKFIFSCSELLQLNYYYVNVIARHNAVKLCNVLLYGQLETPTNTICVYEAIN
jgi:hypothetical protein